MTMKEFILNLKGMNEEGGDYPVAIVKQLYSSIKSHPLGWGSKEGLGDNDGSG